MISLRPTNLLFFAVGFVVFANQVFAHSGLKGRRWAYGAVQGINVAFVAFVLSIPLFDLPDSTRAIVRTFLAIFGTWHFVQSWQARAAVRRAEAQRERNAEVLAFEAELAKRNAGASTGGAGPNEP